PYPSSASAAGPSSVEATNPSSAEAVEAGDPFSGAGGGGPSSGGGGVPPSSGAGAGGGVACACGWGGGCGVSAVAPARRGGGGGGGGGRDRGNRLGDRRHVELQRARRIGRFQWRRAFRKELCLQSIPLDSCIAQALDGFPFPHELVGGHGPQLHDGRID